MADPCNGAKFRNRQTLITGQNILTQSYYQFFLGSVMSLSSVYTYYVLYKCRCPSYYCLHSAVGTTSSRLIRVAVYFYLVLGSPKLKPAPISMRKKLRGHDFTVSKRFNQHVINRRFCNVIILLHRRTRVAYVYNGRIDWYNVVLSSRIHSIEKSSQLEQSPQITTPKASRGRNVVVTLSLILMLDRTRLSYPLALTSKRNAQ